MIVLLPPHLDDAVVSLWHVLTGSDKVTEAEFGLLSHPAILRYEVLWPLP